MHGQNKGKDQHQIKEEYCWGNSPDMQTECNKSSTKQIQHKLPQKGDFLACEIHRNPKQFLMLQTAALCCLKLCVRQL